MEVIDGRLAEAKLVGEDVFPKTILPAAGSSRNLADFVITKRDSLLAALFRHRALLFRGFNVASVDDFQRVVEAFNWDAFPMPPGSVTGRAKLSDRIYTANEASTDHFINFHHEMSLRKSLPSKIFLYCSQPSPEGGETSIVPSDVIVKMMEERIPELMSKVAEFGLIHGTKISTDADSDTHAVLNKSWKSILGTDNEVEAKKRAKEKLSCSSIRFFSDGSAELVYGPLNPVAEHEGRRAWIVPILGYTDNIDMVSNKFGDESAFPLEALFLYKQLLEENCVDIRWQKGDVLLLDNLVVQHARRSGKPPREVLVSMCK